MAAIDKLRVKWWCDRQDLIIWAIKHNPNLLHNIYRPFELTRERWDEWQKNVSTNTDYGDDRYIAIANFSGEQDKWLYWHCPLDFVREYLHKQCGYKDNWLVKLFWKK